MVNPARPDPPGISSRLLQTVPSNVFAVIGESSIHVLPPPRRPAAPHLVSPRPVCCSAIASARSSTFGHGALYFGASLLDPNASAGSVAPRPRLAAVEGQESVAGRLPTLDASPQLHVLRLAPRPSLGESTIRYSASGEYAILTRLLMRPDVGFGEIDERRPSARTVAPNPRAGRCSR
jgi:hypothetical protein